MLWPRILFWVSFVLMVVALLYAVGGWTNSVGLAAKSNTQTGAGFIGFIALAGLMGGKAWMDKVVRSRSRLPCAQCGTRNMYTAMHCSTCGLALRAVHSLTQPKVEEAPQGLGVVCQTCGMRNTPEGRFCSSCAAPLHSAARAT